MAITNVATLRSAVVQSFPILKVNQAATTRRAQSYWTSAGTPAPAASYTLALTGAGAIPVSTDLGAVPFINPASGNTYLSRLTLAPSNAAPIAPLIIYDRLYHAGSYDASLNQTNTITSPPALTRPDSTGVDTELWLEMSTATSATGTPPTVIVNYLNSAGNAFATQAITLATSMVAGQFQPFAPASSDPGTGFRSLVSVVTAGSASFTGSFNVVILRRLAQLYPTGSDRRTELDWVQLGLPQVYDNAHLTFMSIPTGGSTSDFLGLLELAQG